jgi:hypothetical protein
MDIESMSVETDLFEHREALGRLRSRIWQVLGSTPGIRVLTDEGTP